MQDSDMERVFSPSALEKLPEAVILPESVKASFALSNRKREIIFKILKPCSGYGKDWHLENETGFEQCDMYNM